MADKQIKQTTITIAATPEFKARLQALAESSGQSVTSEITKRLEFTMKWESFGSIDALDEALSGLSPVNYAILAVTAEQAKRINEGTYKCVIAAKGTSAIRPYGTRVGANQRHLGNGLNALSDFAPMSMHDLKSWVKSRIEVLTLETDANLSDDDVQALDELSNLTSNAIASTKAIDVISRLSREWLNDLEGFMSLEAVTIDQKRKRARFLRSGELLTTISFSAIDLIILFAHETLSGKAIDKVMQLGVGADLGVFDDEVKKEVARLVDDLDQKMLVLVESFSGGVEITTSIWEGARSLREKLAN